MEIRNARRLPLALLAALALLVSTAAHGQANPSPRMPQQPALGAGTTAAPSALEVQRLELDRQKFTAEQAAEKARIELEREKIALERHRIRWTAAGTIVPLLGILLTFGYSVWSFRTQSAHQVDAQREAARLQFEIKAAEIAFAGKSPLAVLNRGRALKQMFGDRLPESFLQQFDPQHFGGDTEPADTKLVLLNLLMEHHDKQDLVLKLWDQLFPGDHEWRGRVKPNV